MKLKASAAAIFVLAITGAVQAQSENVNLQAMMSPFYTDSDMKTMRSDEEVKAIVAGMKPEDQAAVKAACTTPDQKLSPFCDNVMRAMGDR